MSADLYCLMRAAIPPRVTRTGERTVNALHAVLCAWCPVVIRPGPLPASHGMCETCAARINAELDAMD